jgi:DNA-binding transcriptional ArsR family regulator
MSMMLEAIVGSATAERVLLYLQAYERAHGREIASALGLAQSQVQKQLRKLESGGILVSRLSGRVRIYRWNPRNPLVPPLRTLFRTAVDALPQGEQQKYFRGRRRPRRSGKAL